MNTSMVLLTTVGFSILLQFVTVFFALRLIIVTEWKKAWLLLSLGLIVMGIRRLMTFFDIWSENIIHTPNAIAEVTIYEIIGLIGSVIMLGGVIFIKPIFLSIKTDNDKLSQVMQEQKIILDNVNLGISKIIDRKQVWVNRKTEELFQYAKEEMGDQTTRIFYPSQEAYDKFGIEAYPVLAEGLPYTTEEKMIRKDGTEIWVRLNGKAVEPPNISKGTIWMFEDITEQRNAAEAIRDSEKKLREITSSLGEGLYVLDEHGKVTFMNPEAESLLGWTMEELSDKNIHDVVHNCKQGSSPLPLDKCQIHNVINTGEKYVSLDETFIKKDGTRFPVSVISAPIIENNKIRESVTAFSDITKTKQQQQEKERLITELQKALAKVRTLSEMLPICSYCKKIRDDKGYWEEVATYISKNTDTVFSHGMCPECADRVMKETEEFIKKSQH